MESHSFILGNYGRCIWIGPVRLKTYNTYLCELSDYEREILETLWKNEDYTALNSFLDLSSHKQRGIQKYYIKIWLSSPLASRKRISTWEILRRTEEIELCEKNSESTTYTPGFRVTRDKGDRILGFIKESVFPQFLSLPSLDHREGRRYNRSLSNLKTYISLYYSGYTGKRE